MKKTFLFFPIVFIVFFSFTNNEIQDRLEKLLITAKNENQVVAIHEVVKENDFQNVFCYVPNINPLNPKKLKRFSSQFGDRFHPISKTKKKHYGLDISASRGTAVHTAAKGKVTYIGTKGGYGNNIIVTHKYGFVTRYAHLNNIYVRDGQKIDKGEIIGTVGSTGASTGDHLHFEIIKNKRHIDPYPIIIF